MASVDRRISGDTLPRTIPIPKDTTTTVIAKGELLMLSSNEATPMTAASDNLAFIGVSEGASASGVSAVVVALPDGRTEWDFPLDTATTVAVGKGLAFSTKTALTQQETDSIAICTKAGTNVSTVRCVFKIPKTLMGDTS